MFVVMNRVAVSPDWGQAFEERFQRRAGQIEKNPGFIRMEILRPEEEASPYVVVTVWESRGAFERWVGSADFKAAHADPLPAEAFTAQSVLEQYEVVLRADKR